MTSITSVSQTELTQRRQQLRQQRRLRLLQTLWQTFTVSAIAGSMAWAVTLPGWIIRKPEQITVEGNRFLSTQAIQSLLPLSYPQSLIQLEPGLLAQGLETKAPILTASVTRQLFPPRLTVQVRERFPVAVATPNPIHNSGASADSESSPSSLKAGLLDADGRWMPLNSYTSVDRSFKLPALKIIGMRQQYYPHWSKMYSQVSHSPAKISEIDWRDPANLILKTSLGSVHLGPYGSGFPAQINALDQMQKLSEQIKVSQIAYIDLRNPENPMVRIAKINTAVKSNMR